MTVLLLLWYLSLVLGQKPPTVSSTAADLDDLGKSLMGAITRTLDENDAIVCEEIAKVMQGFTSPFFY
jgi:hypothetical protein